MTSPILRTAARTHWRHHTTRTPAPANCNAPRRMLALPAATLTADQGRDRLSSPTWAVPVREAM